MEFNKENLKQEIEKFLEDEIELSIKVKEVWPIKKDKWGITLEKHEDKISILKNKKK